MTRIILGMTGIARSGKDTAGQRLVEAHGFVRLALGDELKRALLLLDPFVPVDGTGAWTPLSALVAQQGWDEAKKSPVVRSYLQRMGTEAGWQFHGEHLWTSRLDARIAELDPGQDVVVTDIRMPHEARWLRSISGAILRIEREAALEQLTPEQRAHVSEQGIADPDGVVANDAAVEDLHAAVDRVVDALRGDESRAA